LSNINKVLLGIIIAIAVYAIFLLVSDFNTIFDKISDFRVSYLPIILVLVSSGWCVLFLRWTILLKNNAISIPHRKSFLIYIASFSMSATPGQLGELIKSQLLKNKFDIPVTKTAPLVIIERLSDLAGAIIVSVIGFWLLNINIYVPIIASVALALIFLLLKSKKMFTRAINLIKKMRFVSKIADPLSESFDTIQLSLNKKTLILCTILSICYWLIVGISAFFVLKAVGIDTLEPIKAVSIYSSSLIIGAASFIPGGVGVAEGSIAGLLSFSGIDISVAIALGILIRIFTLWYAVLVGFIALKINGGLSN
jgi:uncharacterized protein (TIRG00374 family)